MDLPFPDSYQEKYEGKRRNDNEEDIPGHVDRKRPEVYELPYVAVEDIMTFEAGQELNGEKESPRKIRIDKADRHGEGSPQEQRPVRSPVAQKLADDVGKYNYETQDEQAVHVAPGNHDQGQEE